MKDKADEDRRRLATLPLVEAWDVLSAGDGRTDLQKAREFVFGALMVACSPEYREIVRTTGSEAEAGELDGTLVLNAGVGALWAIMMLGKVGCDQADEMMHEAVEKAHEEHHRKVERIRAKRRKPSEN